MAAPSPTDSPSVGGGAVDWMHGAALLVGVGGILVKTVAAQLLWLWFVVPVFGLPVIGFWQMLGLMTFIALFRGGSDNDDDPWTLTKKFASATTKIGFLLLIGYIAALAAGTVS